MNNQFKKFEVTLKGRSRHGKNRVNEHGNKWQCIEERNGHLLLVNGDKEDQNTDMRWIMKQGDINFEVIFDA
jgi:hypothetical protein